MKTIFKKVMLNTDWSKVDLGKYDDFYIIAEKCKGKCRSDTVNKNLVRKLKFEVGVESFSKKKMLTINYITLNFSDVSSSDLKLNDITAILKVLNYPTKFFIKPIEIVMDDGAIIKEGKTSIKVGVNPAKLN